MLGNLFFLISVAVLLVGCVVLFFDVIVAMSTDRCKVAEAGEYVPPTIDDNVSDKGRFFVLSVPEFRYRFEGKKHQRRSANMFFHWYLPAGRMAVPFLPGKTYEVYVNPAKPTMFITAGEQRFPFLRQLGCLITLVGIILVLAAMNAPAA